MTPGRFRIPICTHTKGRTDNYGVNNRLEIVANGLAHVLERPAAEFPADANLWQAGVDSISLVVLADVIEATHPELRLSDAILRDAITVGDLAEGLEQR